jgi:3-oxoacyl-[acyl-carrier-protein] synthase I
VASRWIDGGGALLAGVGLVSALGYDAGTALAAARAGVSRAGVQPHWRKRSGVSGLEEPVTGHAADLLTLGFEGEARLQRLASGALQDLLVERLDNALLQQRVGLYVAMPDPERAQSCPVLRGAASSPPPAAAGEPSTAERARAFVQGVAAGVPWAQAPSTLFWSHLGHAAGAVVLGAAVQDLQARKIDTAIVLAVDSLIDEDTLGWLSACGRLKCDDMPAGLMPGEAAVALALRRPGETAGPLASFRGMAFAEEPLAQSEARLSTGEVLTEAVARVWSDSAQPAAWLLADHNGEHHRAHEWGSTLARLRATGDAFADPALWLPALSFGDTGAASMPLAVAMASHAWQRGSAPGTAAVVAACSDGGARAALLLTSH